MDWKPATVTAGDTSSQQNTATFVTKELMKNQIMCIIEII